MSDNLPMMRAIPQPVIAAANGAAAGIGHELGLSWMLWITKRSLWLNQGVGNLEAAARFRNT